MSRKDNQRCPIWPEGQVRAVETDSGGKMTMVYASTRAGGDYKLNPSIVKRLSSSGRGYYIDPPIRARLTTWLVDQREQGDPCPEVTSDVIEMLKDVADLPVHIRADRFLLHLSRLTHSIGQEIDTSPGSPNFGTALAWTESTKKSELEFLDEYLQDMDWLNPDSKFPVVSVEGYARIAELTVGSESKRVFVAMSFDDEMKRIYGNAIKPVIRRAGFDPHIVGQGRSTERIEDEAEASIRESRFVVADFTHGNREPRGSVYYEAGFARGLGKPIVFMAKEGTRPHFNTSHFPHIFWKNDDDLKKQLIQRIRNMPQLNAGGQTG